MGQLRLKGDCTVTDDKQPDLSALSFNSNKPLTTTPAPTRKTYTSRRKTDSASISPR